MVVYDICDDDMEQISVMGGEKERVFLLVYMI